MEAEGALPVRGDEAQHLPRGEVRGSHQPISHGELRPQRPRVLLPDLRLRCNATGELVKRTNVMG